MPNYRRMARRSAQRYGLNPDIFERQINQESGFADDVIHGRRVSSAGAQGIAQIMPATARGWGVNPLNPKAALDAAAKNMARYVKAYGSYENALRAYNAGPGAIERSKGYAETNQYVANILRGTRPSARGVRPSGGGGPRTGGTSGGGGTSRFDLRLASPANAAAALSAVTAQRPRPPTTPPSAPSFSAGVSMPQGYTGLEPAQAEQARTDYASALQKINEAGAQTQSIADLIKRTDIPGVQRGGGGGTSGGGTPASKGGARVSGELKELIWRGPGAQTVDNGQRVPTSTFSGHTDHVHAAGRQQAMIALGKKAQQMGLTVRENPAFDPVDPVHTEGSWHYGRRIGGKNYRAIDVSGDVGKMRRFAKLVARSYGV